MDNQAWKKSNAIATACICSSKGAALGKQPPDWYRASSSKTHVDIQGAQPSMARNLKHHVMEVAGGLHQPASGHRLCIFLWIDDR